MALTQIFRSLLLSALAPLLIFTLVTGVVRILGLRRIRVPWIFLSITVTAAVAMLAVAYLFLPVLFEDAETDIACVSALAMRGLPLYPAIEAAPRYILLYGPLTYLAHIPFYWILGRNLAAFKFPGVAALLVSLLGLYGICRGYATARVALIGMGCAALVLFRYIGVEFWGRIDPLILVLTVMCIWAIVRSPRWVVILINALAFAIIPNLKVSGFAYLLPILALLIVSKGWRTAVMTTLLGAALLPLPFLLPGISLTNYLTILKVATVHGLVLNFLVRNVQYSVLLLLPVLIPLFKNRRASLPQTVYLASIVLGLVITSILGSKSGAGSYHLIPYIVPILHLYFWRRSELPPDHADREFSKFAIAWTATTLFLASTHLQTVIHEYRVAPLGQNIIAEVERDQDLYRGRTIEVGVGKNFDDPRTRYGYLTTFRGQPYTISGAAVRDLQAGGIPVPDSTVQYIESCGTQVWLIPKGDAPFSANNTYFETPQAAFELRFQQAFLSHYRPIASGEFFDAWACGK